MPVPRPRPWPFAVLVLLIATASCNGNSSTSVPPNPPGTTCSPGTPVQLSMPQNGSTGNPTHLGSIQIVVDANIDLLGNSWDLVLVDEFGKHSRSGTLSLASNPGGSHPFPTDYYYNGSVSPLTAGDVYNVYLNQTTSQCSPMFLGSFGT
jgi:hypothetical protein